MLPLIVLSPPSDEGATYRKAYFSVGRAWALMRVVGFYTGAKPKSLRALVTIGVQSYMLLRALYSSFSRASLFSGTFALLTPPMAMATAATAVTTTGPAII